MKWNFIAASASCILFGVSCSAADLGGELPLPFTDPSTSAKLDLELRPMPPKFCIGLDLIPTE